MIEGLQFAGVDRNLDKVRWMAGYLFEVLSWPRAGWRYLMCLAVQLEAGRRGHHGGALRGGRGGAVTATRLIKSGRTMARKAAPKERNGRLEEALATVINNQAMFVGQLARTEANTAERFARIESELAQIRSILLHHEQILEALPEAIRQKIGFVKPQ